MFNLNLKKGYIEYISEIKERIKNSKIYLLGINYITDLSLDLLNKNDVLIYGIIDEYTSSEKYKNYKIFKELSDISEDALIISCIVDGKPLTIRNKLNRLGFSNCNYLDLKYIYPEFVFPHYNKKNVSDITKNIEKYNYLNNLLEDKFSKATLIDITNFRYSFDLNYMKNYQCNLENQYFEDFVPWDKIDIFIDGGSFDGNTTHQYIRLKNEKYKRIFLFEPNKEQMNICKNQLSNFQNITFIEAATYKNDTILKFNNSLGSASCISDEGESIQAVRIDDYVKGNGLIFLKLDVEGAELDSLRGASKIIKHNKPVIAVCVYHDQEDFWKIPEYILSIHKDYKVYLRHYTEGLLETVMYFI